MIDAERWDRIKAVFQSALDRAPHERAEFLRETCGADGALYAEVESLLSAHELAGDFVERPAIESLSTAAARALDTGGRALRRGDGFGPYEITDFISAGGMGEVYRARDPKLARDVAIKILPPTFTQHAERLARFEREARVLAALNHPHIGVIYELAEANGLRGLVLEFVEGETLADRLHRGPVPVDEALPIARQIADAVETAHDKGIIHRDLKPGNIKITPDGVVKVLDFGLAKALTGDDSTPDLTSDPTVKGEAREGRVMGTAAYMSPEQASGKKVDRRTDIWAFGVILFEMVAGHRPFSGETTSDTLASVLKIDPNWSALPASVPPDLRRLLRRCLEKDPKRRLQAIGEARVRIEDLLSGAPDPESLVATSGAVPAPGSRRVGVGLGAVALAVAAVALGWSIWPRQQRTVAPSFTRVVRLTHTPANEYGPAISPDGKWVAYLSDARGPIDIWVKFVAGGEASNLTESTGLDVGLRRNAQLEISPDGTAIAARVRTGSGTDTWLIPAPLPGAPRKFIEDAAALRWSPDGRRVAYYRVGQTAGEPLFVAAADGTNRVELVQAQGGVHLHRPAWSHDGRHVYFVSTTTRFDQEPAGIFRVAATGGAIEPVIQTSRRALDPLPMPDGAGLIYAANPTTADLNLWWRPLDGSTGAVRLTTGVGEYAEPRMSTDGRRMVATLLDVRQWLVRLPVAHGDNGHIADLKTRATDSVMLTRSNTGDLDPTVAPQGPNRLVFSSTRGGSRQLWTALPDGSDLRPLTSGAALDERPAVSPDGQQVAFISDRGGERGIWLIGLEGGTPQFLGPATDVIDMLTWSPDGRQIAYAVVGGDLPELRVMSLADKRPRKLQTPAAASAPAWSPTDVIAYLEPLGSTSTRVAFINSRGQPLYSNLPPAPNLGFPSVLAWAPDGRRLASAAVEGLWIIEPDAPQPFRKVAGFPGSQRPHGVAWTRDGSSLIVAIEETRGDLVLFERQ
jgi:Tol biopolymer transport system component/tRNA A-37 threonylcarbamoyl transferase component Bud32